MLFLLKRISLKNKDHNTILNITFPIYAVGNLSELLFWFYFSRIHSTRSHVQIMLTISMKWRKISIYDSVLKNYTSNHKKMNDEWRYYAAFYSIYKTHAPDNFYRLSLEITRFFRIVKIIVCSDMFDLISFSLSVI